MNPPNSLPTPPLLQKIQWVIDPVGYMENGARQFPDMFVADVVGFGNKLVFVNHPQAIQEILTNDRKRYTAPGELNEILAPLVGNYSVFMLSGDRHRRRRQLLMPPFHGDRMKTYAELIRNLTIEICDRLATGEVFTARSTMQQVSLQVILQTVFGLREGKRLEQIRTQLSSLMEMFRSPVSSSPLFFDFMQRDLGNWSPWGKFLRLQKAIDHLIYAEIAERHQQDLGDRTDILSLLMSARDEAGQPMTDQELRDELITLLTAGHETTATAMAWGLYWLNRLPQVREKVLHELDSQSAAVDPASITRLPYFTAFCNEVLRIHPVAMLTFPRVVHEPVELLGHHLESGTILVGCIYLVHQREDLYPQPTQFRPERFLERQFSPFEFIPFGGGARRCIGEALALFELKLVLATIISNYELELASAKPEVPRRRGVTLAPGQGVRIRITGKRTRPEPAIALSV
jgi:unspecific monooxygenase